MSLELYEPDTGELERGEAVTLRHLRSLETDSDVRDGLANVLSAGPEGFKGAVVHFVYETLDTAAEKHGVPVKNERKLFVVADRLLRRAAQARNDELLREAARFCGWVCGWWDRQFRPDAPLPPPTTARREPRTQRRRVRVRSGSRGDPPDDDADSDDVGPRRCRGLSPLRRGA